MFFDIIVNLISVFWSLLKIPVLLAVSLLLVIGFLTFVRILYLRIFKKMKRPEGVRYKVRKRNFFQKLFIDAPKQIALDYFSRSPEYFPYQGVIVFTGRQGRGKTIALIEQSRRYQQEFPKCQVIGNVDYKYQDDTLDHWTKLIDYKNEFDAICGVCCQIDEMQNWFSSNQSKDFPPQMLEVITQNRKNRRVILGTSQVFTRLSKPLREQCTEIRECHTFLRCITFVIRKEPFLNTMGEVDKLKYRGMYWFVHDQELRDSYDTYKVIESLRESGFAPQAPETNNNVNVTITKQAMRKLK